MISANHLFLFVLASLTLNLLPGPDMIYIMSRTISGGKKDGVHSTLGVSTGLVIHAFIAASGLSLILLHSTTAFTAVRIIGSAYLIYMGAKLLISNNISKTQSMGAMQPNSSRFRSYKKGFLVNLLNPKVIIFFMAFMPQFIQPQIGHIFYQFFLYGILFNLTGTCVNLSAVLLTNHVKTRVGNSRKFKRIQEKITGVTLVILGGNIALLHVE